MEEDLSSLERRLRECKRKVVVLFDEHFDSSRYTPKYHLPDHLVHDTEIFRTPFFLDSSLYKFLRVRIKQTYDEPSQRRRTRSMVAVSVIERGYKMALSYGKKDGGKLRRYDERLAGMERSRL